MKQLSEQAKEAKKAQARAKYRENKIKNPAAYTKMIQRTSENRREKYEKNPVAYAVELNRAAEAKREKYQTNKTINPAAHAANIQSINAARYEKNKNNSAAYAEQLKRDAEAHLAEYTNRKNNNPVAHAEWLKKRREFRAQKKKENMDLFLPKGVPLDLEFDSNVFDKDVSGSAQAADTNFDSDSELGSEWDFDTDFDKDVLGSAQAASAADLQPFNTELYYPQGPQVNSYLETEEALGYNRHSGGKIKSFDLTIKRKHNNKKSIKRKRHKINKQVTIKPNNKKRRKTRKIK